MGLVSGYWISDYKEFNMYFYEVNEEWTEINFQVIQGLISLWFKMFIPLWIVLEYVEIYDKYMHMLNIWLSWNQVKP